MYIYIFELLLKNLYQINRYPVVQIKIKISPSCSRPRTIFLIYYKVNNVPSAEKILTINFSADIAKMYGTKC